MQFEILADTVEDNHLVVDGITNHGEDSTDKRLVDFERERHEIVEQRIETDDCYGINSERYDRAYRERHVAESEQDVEEDSYESDKHRDDSSVCDVFRYRRSHLC